MLLEIQGKKYYIENDNNINCIMLYGSWARGENDIYSDMDILIITETITTKKYIIHDSAGNAIPEQGIVVYGKENIERMKKYTSLFLWHIKLEALYLYKKDFYMDEFLNSLPEYNKTSEDIFQYKVICGDIRELMEKKLFITLFYEVTLLASIVRNIAIAYCYINGKKCFGRNRPVIFLIKDYPFFSIEEYEELYVFRSLYNNSEDKSYRQIDDEYIWKWITIVENLIEIMEEKICTKKIC